MPVKDEPNRVWSVSCYACNTTNKKSEGGVSQAQFKSTQSWRDVLYVGALRVQCARVYINLSTIGKKAFCWWYSFPLGAIFWTIMGRVGVQTMVKQRCNVCWVVMVTLKSVSYRFDSSNKNCTLEEPCVISETKTVYCHGWMMTSRKLTTLRRTNGCWKWMDWMDGPIFSLELLFICLYKLNLESILDLHILLHNVFLFPHMQFARAPPRSLWHASLFTLSASFSHAYSLPKTDSFIDHSFTQYVS